MSTPDLRHTTRPGSTWRVLVVEDNSYDATLCRRQLEQAGYRPIMDVVASPEEFEKALRQECYDVVLADYNLPSWSWKRCKCCSGMAETSRLFW